MNTMSDTVLEKMPHHLFTDRDVSILFPEGRDRRYSLMKRALKTGDIIRVRRGLYCLSQKYQHSSMNRYYIAEILYGPSYVSVEAALSYHGFIPEGVVATTCVSARRSKEYKTPYGTFMYHRVPQKVLYAGVERRIEGNSCFFMASPLKALCDYVYVRKENWTSLDPLMHSLRIDRDRFDPLTNNAFDMLYDNYRSRRVRAFLKGVRKELAL